MYQNKRILAIIPTRGGSKGIPLKNIIHVGGRPLIEYSIDCADASKYLDRTIISTDSLEIKETAERYIQLHAKKVDIPFLRPKELATDMAKTIEVLIHAIQWLQEIEDDTYDYVVLIQNTVPLRKGWHIDEAIEKLFQSHETSLVSVTEVQEHPILMRSINKEGILINLLNQNSTVRRQDFPKFYKVDGAIYIQKLDDSFNSNTSLNDGKLPYIMESCYTVDIDTYIDLKNVEYYLEKEKEKEMELLQF